MKLAPLISIILAATLSVAAGIYKPVNESGFRLLENKALSKEKQIERQMFLAAAVTLENGFYYFTALENSRPEPFPVNPITEIQCFKEKPLDIMTQDARNIKQEIIRKYKP